MYKKFASAVLLLSIAVTGAACSTSEGKDTAASATPAATAAVSAAPSENPDLYKTTAYIAARMAEEKVNVLFHQNTTEDGKPLMNSVIAADKEKAAAFLNTYLDPALTEKVLTHYLTEEKADGAVVVKKDNFFSVSVLATQSKDEVTIEGDQNEVKITTKDGGVYTVKKAADKYVVSDFAKK